MERQKKERDPLALFIGLSGLIATAAYVNIIAPDSLVSLLGFFVILGVASTSLGIYLFRHTRHAWLVSGGIVLYLILRLIGLKQPLYAVLLIASIIALEFLWKEQG